MALDAACVEAPDCGLQAPATLIKKLTLVSVPICVPGVMELIDQITEAQWLALAEFVMEELNGRPCTSDPLELSYEQVAEKLGYTREVDFYMALWRYHQQRLPEPAFWFHPKHRPWQPTNALMFYLRSRD
jgi:hypothetical protein